MTVVDPERDERGWAITNAPGTTSDPVNHFQFLSEAYVATNPAFDGHVIGAGAVGHPDEAHRQQRVVRDHPHARRRVRRVREAPRAPLPARGAARADRRAQRLRLRQRQQRRLPHGVREDADGLREGLRAALRRPRRAGRATRGQPLPVRRRAHRGRLAPVPDARALRRGLRRTLQVQPAPHRRLPAALGLSARPLPAPRHRGRPSTSTRSSGTTTARTRRSTRPASSRSGRRSTSRRRTIARRSRADPIRRLQSP